MFGKFVVNAREPTNANDNATTTDGEFESTSCFCLKRTFFVRKWFIHLVHWPWFERLSMVVILVNCVCLALADPLDQTCSETKCKQLKKINIFVLWFFVAEMVIKMTAMGIIGKRSYFSDGWNRLDFIIVSAGIVDEFSGLDGAFLITIRLVRVLRPLRAINRVPSIRILVTLLLEALPLLGNVFALAFLVLFIFGIVGVQMWQGVLRNRCFLNSSVLRNAKSFNSPESCYYQPSFDQPEYLCSLPSDSGMHHCSEIPFQASCWPSNLASGNYCYSANSSVKFNNSYFSCLQEGPNPFYTTVSFDNIGYAWLAIFQIITLEGWTDIMYIIQAAYGYWNWIYFVILILIGPFFLVNLCLVVLAMQFQETKSRELQLLEEDRKKKIEAQKVFKDTKWGKVIDLMKSNITESIQKRPAQHIHHHHHIHHYYHHEHVLQNPASPSQASVSMATTQAQLPTVVLSHENSPAHSPPASQKPNDPFIAVELTSSCKISQNFLSPDIRCSGRASPTWSVGSSSLDRFSFSPDVVSLHACEESRTPTCSNLATASTTVSVNVTSNRIRRASVELAADTESVTKTEVFATAAATASVTTEQTLENENHKSQRNESLEKSNRRPRNLLPTGPSRAGSQSFGYSLKTLDVSELEAGVNGSPKEYRGIKKRTESYQRKTENGRKMSNTEDRASQGSLEDVFGSMFDIQRFAQYNVSQDITKMEKCKQMCAKLANNSWFINFIMVVILINTVTMATEHYQQPEFLNEFLEKSNICFITIFLLEMIIKIFGEGIKAYISQWFNIFDGFIVIISIIEVILLRGGGGLSVLRSIRLLRIFRLVRPIRHQLIVMVHTMSSVVTFTAMLFLFMFTFAVLGMNLFGGKMILPTADCQMQKVRSNFDTFFVAMVTIFQILTLEDWNVVMRNAMRSSTHWAAIYFVTLTIIGYYVLFNLLVAILVEGFTNPVVFQPNLPEVEDENPGLKRQANKPNLTTDWLALIKRAKEEPIQSVHTSNGKNEDDLEDVTDLENLNPESYEGQCTTKAFSTPSIHCGPAMRGAIGRSYEMQANFKNQENSFGKRYLTNLPSTSRSENEVGFMEPVDGERTRKPKTVSKAHGLRSPKLRTSSDHYFSRNNSGFSNDNQVSQKFSKPKIIITSEHHVRSLESETVEEKIETRSCDQEESSDTNHSKSLFIFAKDNKFRQLMIKISTSKWFDNFILFLIVVSCVFMVLDQPNSSAQQTKIVYTASFIFTILFTIEVVIKVIAQGLFIGKDAYLRLGWNILDFLIVIISWLHVITSSFNSTSPGILGSVKVLRALRTLRPLRMIRRAPGLKLVVEALLRSLKPIGNTVLIAGIFFIVFGILGIQLFKGKFYHCDGDSEVKTKQDCLTRNKGQWINRPYNFDNLAQTLVTLFVLATRDGWVTLMHHAVDAVGIDFQPKENYNQWRVLYFVSFMMVVGFLVLNMVVGIVVNNYQLCQEKQEKSDRKLKREQQETENEIVYEDKTTNASPEELQLSSFRHRCFRLCHSKYWDSAIAFVIGVNVILMALEHYKMSKNYKIFLDVNNYVCTGIFIVEAFVKLTALGCRGYFQDRWNILDFLVVIFSIFGIIMDLVYNSVKVSVKPTVIRGLRVLRIIRVLKLFKVAKGVRSLLDTITTSLPQVANLGILLFLLFFIYSSLGIQLFGSIECSGQYSCHGLDPLANFQDFQTAMLTLFRVATGDNWNTIYMDTLRSKCDSSASCQKNCCFSKYVAPVYFTTFVLATHFVLLNVLVAVLMKDLKASREKIAAVLSRDKLDKRVLQLTLSATKFVKDKAFSRKSKTPADSGEIELKQIRSNLAPG